MASSSQDAMAPETTSRQPMVEDELPEDTKMSDPPEHPPVPDEPGYSEKSHRTIKHIMDTRINDYYGILSLEKTCTLDEIEKRYKKLAKLTHPDKNRWPDSQKAFQRLATAYAVLKDPSKRRSYDKNGGKYSPPDVQPEMQFGEEFGPNAFGGGDSGSELDDVSEDEISTTLKPSEAIKQIYRAATRLIQGILDDPPSSREKPELIKKINSFNNDIKDQNKVDGLDDKNLGQFLIQYTIFESNALLARPHWEKLKKDPHDSSALEKMGEIERTLKNAIAKNDYDSGWCYEALGFKPNGGSPPSRGQHNTGHGGDSSTTGKPTSPQKNTVVKWRGPGYTLTGEKIIAMIPRTRTGARIVNGVPGEIETYINGYQFILKDEDEDTIELVPGASIGETAKQGYLSLPKEQIKDARYSEQRYSIKERPLYHSLVDFASMPFKTRSSQRPRHPPGYGLVQFKDGKEDILSRTALRSMLGEVDADFTIQEVLKAKDKVPTWMIEPETMSKPRQMVIEKPTARRRRLEARFKGELSETDREGLFVPKDRTTTRRETSAADEKIDRMEKELQELKEMIKKLVLK